MDSHSLLTGRRSSRDAHPTFRDPECEPTMAHQAFANRPVPTHSSCWIGLAKTSISGTKSRRWEAGSAWDRIPSEMAKICSGGRHSPNFLAPQASGPTAGWVQMHSDDTVSMVSWSRSFFPLSEQHGHNTEKMGGSLRYSE